jgi:hypothetical protein
MKNIVRAFVVLALVSAPLQAAPIEWDLKIIKLIMPFQEVNAVYLYDFVNSENMGGIETPIAASGKWTGVVGAADVEGSDEAIPYVGFDVAISDKYFGERFNLGGFLAYDFDTEEERVGLKASILLWGLE